MTSYSPPPTYSQPTSPPPATGGADPSMPDASMPDASMPDASMKDASMKDKATEAVDQGKQAAGHVAETATQHAQEVTSEVTRQARDLVGEAREHATRQAGDQHRNLVTNLRSLSSELGSMVDRSDNPGTATELVSQARERVDGVVNWLDGREPGDLVDELRTFARRRPGTFLLGALAAGVVAGRLTRGAVAAHTEDGSDASTASTQPATQPSTQPAVPATTVDPAGGYAHSSGQAGYEQQAPGYSMGGSYGEPAAAPGPEQGYGATSTYGDAGTDPGTAAYPAGGYTNGTQR